ncbi:ricin-type beta-trefoil lectin domain protein [Amycolatopsis sp. OK19-0408]|uniref:Ricin-type beta-trefoil lectin domain protein n=1 Tax=Amycolatopsis iheyensis TaxID=2945988 RepID=A0A9X2NDB1_9PSEU|nr:ricin-type beta-trefoil lectin domain protein [Amycolatopsis iheyensis]MCR6486584.1 ricin-type beta-trefoil lectin domain protein [Amycolatopsis iheyensis]
MRPRILGLALAAAVLTATPAAAITGGSQAADGTYTFVAKVTSAGRACTGALVAPQWVLTASSCFADPAQPGTATATVGGRTAKITTLVPRADRNLALAQLDAPVFTVAPVALATSPVQTGETLRIAGYGRTATTWVPDKLSTANFTVQSSTTTTLAITAADATTCKGDAGGPALRETGGVTELVAVNATSWQHGCLGETETRQGTTETRLDEITDWVRAQIPPYAIRNFNGLCTGDGPQVTLTTCAAGQHWTLPGDGTVRTADGRCVAVAGTALVTAPCTAGPEQQWRFPGDGTFRTAAGACADIGSNAPGTPLITVGCAEGNLSQQWFLKGDGTLRNSNGLCADLGSNAVNTPITMVACGADLVSQRWGLLGGALRNTNSLCADLGSNTPGSRLIMIACQPGNPSQQWTAPGDGTLRNHNGLCADLGSNDPGTRVITAACVAGNPSQQWRLDR